MAGFDTTADMPAAVRYHRDAIEQILQCVDERVYCALLGPRLCGKTLLLRFIESDISKLLGWTCAYIDLLEMRANTQQAFFADLIRMTAKRLEEQTGYHLPAPDELQASSAVFRAFLSDCLMLLQRDLVLIIDPLEALPTDLVQALLTSLRAAYMDQQTMPYQVTVVVSGALSLASLTVGESSPFRGIARRVFVGDLDPENSQALIQEMLDEGGVIATRPAVHRLLQATSGDLYLMRRITQCSVELSRARDTERLRAGDVGYILDRFLRVEVTQYAPLVDAIRLIEEDPDLLECILRLLEQDLVQRAELPLPLSPDLDPLYLTGVIEIALGDRYRVQNGVYRQFLIQHFTPGRVGHVLAMAGRWDAAIDYLEASIVQGNRHLRVDLLPATINSIYASQDLTQAVHFLRRGLAVGFDASASEVWFSPPQENYLRLVGPSRPSGPGGPGDGWNNQQIGHSADRLEARAFRQQVVLRGQEGGTQMVRAIPLMIPGQKPIGVVTIYDDPSKFTPAEQRERDLQLVGFLNQAARAVQAVNIRRQELALAGRMQASLLPAAPLHTPGWQMAASWRPARETSGDFYDFIELPNGRLGLVIADVVDKGMGAALLMALCRTLIRTYAFDYSDQPEQLLQVANQRILADTNAGQFVTLFYGILDLASGVLTYCNAGHPPPYILLGGEFSPAEALPRTGMPLGISDDAEWERAVALVPPGALLLLYTDGVLDAQNPQAESFGVPAMLSAIQAASNQPADRVQETLLSAVYAHAGGEPQMDDITLLVLKHV